MKEILRKTKDKERQVKELFRRFTSSILDQYTTVLFILALSIGVSYLVVIYDLKNQEGNATLIQLSTEQSQLVQAINFYATELTTSDNEQSIREAKGKMSRKVARLKEIHQSLKSGDRYVREGSRIVQVQGLLEDDLKKLYLEGDHSLDNQMRDYNTLLRDLQHTPIDELQSKLAQFDELFLSSLLHYLTP